MHALLESDEEARMKYKFTVQATELKSPFANFHEGLDRDVVRAIEWIGEHTAEEAIAEREEVTCAIEALGKQLRSESAEWIAGADAATTRISSQVNGPLGQYLAEITGFTDPEAMELLRDGADMVGTLHASGLGTPHEFPEATKVSDLAATCAERNVSLLNSLKEDPHAGFLLDEVWADSKRGRMTRPKKIEDVDLATVLLARRFSREQGVRENGEVKLRAVDDETASGTNPACRPQEKLHNDQPDAFASVIARLVAVTGCLPHLWKADVDAAYRRVPVRADHRWLVWIAFLLNGQVWAAGHNACCFGSTASVHAWHRVGALLCHVARVMLHLPLLRYVDDYFSADRAESSAHALQCFARVVRAIMGDDALAEHKLQHGMPLNVLGLTFTVTMDHIHIWPSQDKTDKWLGTIRHAIATKHLAAAEAGKLAGRLGFAAQHSFMGLGRTMLRPLFCQQYAPLPRGRVGPLLQLALQWWELALELPLQQQVPVRPDGREVVELFCDARGTPPRIGAVLVDRAEMTYTDWEPPLEVVQALHGRKDEQIMAMELIAIVVGLATFMERCRGRCIRVWTDNAGGEGALRKKAAKQSDHNALVHAVWLMAARNNVGLWIERVGTKDNIADDPSRGEYKLLELMGAKYSPPTVPDELWEPHTWMQQPPPPPPPM